jgi:formylmethanofuran dehydrogenase subunit B
MTLYKGPFVCTGCALLCDDIAAEIQDNRIIRVDTACRKGVSRIKGCSSPMSCMVNGKAVDIDTAIKEAAMILKSSKHPLIFGHGNCTLETQKKTIELARKIYAHIDDTSSFCQGPLIEAILNEKLPTCTLEEVRHKADVVIFWGADPSNSHPRHLSMYSYFPRGKERQRGWEEDRTAITIDIRKSDTAALCGDKFYEIPINGDSEFINALFSALSNKVPKTSFNMDPKKILELANILKKSDFGVIFAGLGMVYSLDSLEPLLRLINKLNETSKFYLIPMVGQYNMRGFDHTLFKETGYINRVYFGREKIEHGPQHSIIELINNNVVDAALIIGSDPLASLPGEIAKKLANIPLITIDPCNNLTSQRSKVTISSALSGVECAGTAIRMDGVEVTLKQIIETDRFSDEQIIKQIMGKI